MKDFKELIKEKVEIDSNDDNETVISDDKLGIQFIIGTDVVEVTMGSGDFKTEYMKKDIKKIIKLLNSSL